jgi:predicted DNA-binding protein
MHYKMHCMSKTGDAQITFRLPSRTASKLERLASRRGVQRSVILREAVERVVAQDETDTKPSDLVADLIGSLKSGVPDLGSDHRKHLGRAFGRGR